MSRSVVKFPSLPKVRCVRCLVGPLVRWTGLHTTSIHNMDDAYYKMEHRSMHYSL